MPPLACEKLNGTRRVPASNACVTEPSRMNVTLVMLPPSGVSTNSEWPYPTTLGVVPVILGRAPLKRYGGEYLITQLVYRSSAVAATGVEHAPVRQQQRR